MTTTSAPTPISLIWAENVLVQQPEPLRHAYQQAAQEIVRALSQPVYSAVVAIPCGKRVLVVRAGTVLYQVFKKTCSAVLIQKLQMLLTHSQQEVRESAQLTCYLVGKHILAALPDELLLRDHYTAFDGQGGLVAPDLPAAETLITQLIHFVHLLNQVGALYPAWETADRFSEKHGLITTHLIQQGRALANFHTQKIIQNILTAWKSEELTRGLTIFLPYLDERQYQMSEYKIVVMPAGRILFRPEFVIGACRVSERHVRSATNLSQATRWQLLSQLDTIIQAFETDSYSLQ